MMTMKMIVVASLHGKSISSNHDSKYDCGQSIMTKINFIKSMRQRLLSSNHENESDYCEIMTTKTNAFTLM